VESGVRRFGRILASVTVVCVALFAQTKAALPGMSQFTDTEFGFSFRYPAAWKVVHEPVSDPSSQGWFPDAKIVKELQIGNPAALVDGEKEILSERQML
jgi:hypothetical protein